MSSEEFEMLKLRLEARHKMVGQVFAGFRDILLATATVCTIWIQRDVQAKADLAAKSAATSEVINTSWLAERTGAPEAAMQAAKAVQRFEKVTEGK